MVTKKRFSRHETEKTKKESGAPPPKGLRNLGNTCYLNSALQCICRVSALRHLLNSVLEKEFSATVKQFNDNGWTNSLQLYVPSLHSPLTKAFIAFTDDAREGTRQIISPAPLRDLLIRQYPRFEGFEQQDSHEVLRCLLDGLRQEEVKRWQKAVLTTLKINPKEADEKSKAEIKAWGRSLSLCTTIDRIFGGVLLTSLTCCECHTVRSNFEIFLDLSLPILEESTRTPPHTARKSSRTDASASDQKRDSSTEKSRKSKRELKRERKAKAKLARPKRKNKYSKFKGQCRSDSDFDDIVDVVDSPLQDEADDIKVEDVHLSPEAEVTAPVVSAESSADDAVVTTANLPPSGKKPLFRNDEEGATTTGLTTSQPGQAELLNKDSEAVRRRIELLADAQNDITVEESDVPEFRSAQSNPASPVVPEEMESSFIVLSSSSPERKGDGNDGESGDLADSGDNLADDEDEGLSDCHQYGGGADQDEESAEVCQLAASFADVRLDAATGISSSLSEEAQAKSIAQRALSQSSSSASSLTDLERCLARYTASEALSDSNRIVCETCTRRQQHSGTSKKTPVLCRAIKKDIIILPPAVLTIHLKRFQQVSYRLQKSSKKVSFPVRLDLSPYCSRLSWNLHNGHAIYRLFGVVEHCGSMRGGHYVSYIAVDSPPMDSSSGTTEVLHPRPDFLSPLEKPATWPLNNQHLVGQLRRCDRSCLLDKDTAQNIASCDDDGFYSMQDSSPKSAASSKSFVDAAGARVDDLVTSSSSASSGSDSDHNPAGCQWYHCSDTHVAPVSLSTVLSCQPYILFYERI
nr:unnamed protein product [Spirometra erinaceieuropaei]